MLIVQVMEIRIVKCVKMMEHKIIIYLIQHVILDVQQLDIKIQMDINVVCAKKIVMNVIFSKKLIPLTDF